jgi:uncharacterized protein YbjT (DUF2867 family)
MGYHIQNVLIIGAGGRLGSILLSAIDAEPKLTVSVLSRVSSKATFPSHIEVHTIADEYPEAELVTAFKGKDAVIAAVGFETIPRQKSFIDAAIKSGVKRFIPSEFGGEPENDKAAALLSSLFEQKKQILSYLYDKEKDGLTWTGFATGAFFEL